MAKPRIFVSSTYYDLKHIRSSLDIFIESLGFEPVLSEKGDIAYTPDIPLDESCYREASNADIFVLLIGGRYGSEASSEKKKPTRAFFERYDSITKNEYENAIKQDIPIYILIESQVYTEYQTFLRNKDQKKITYAHVDSVNIFMLIEEILSKPRNNPVQSFDKFADIENWLREQWAGLFRELLQRQSQQQQLATLTSQVGELREINKTLRKYLEAIITGIEPDASSELIEGERKRLQELEKREQLKASNWTLYCMSTYGLSSKDIEECMKKAKSFLDFAKLIGQKTGMVKHEQDIMRIIEAYTKARDDFNHARSILGLKTFSFKPQKEEEE